MLLLNLTINEDPLNEEADKTFLITTFHPYLRECDKIVERNWDLLDKSSSTRPLLKLNMINRRAKNFVCIQQTVFDSHIFHVHIKYMLNKVPFALQLIVSTLTK